MSMIVPWTTPGGPQCCCAPTCLVYSGPPNIDPPNELNTSLSSPWGANPDLYDLSVVDISESSYQSLLVGGTWNIESRLIAEIYNTTSGTTSYDSTVTQSISVENICEYQATEEFVFDQNNDFSSQTTFERRLFFHPSIPTTRKAKIAVQPRFFDDGDLVSKPTAELYGVFWPITGIENAPGEFVYSQFWPATFTWTAGSDTFAFDETDGFHLVQRLSRSVSASLDVTAAFSPSAP